MVRHDCQPQGRERRSLPRGPGAPGSADGYDGRSEVVSFAVDEEALPDLIAVVRVADDIFVQIGHTWLTSWDRPGWVADRLLHVAPLENALRLTHCLDSCRLVGTVRAVVRVSSEKLFTRTALRASIHRALLRLLPQWSLADPAGCEVWICQYRQDAFIAGVRLTDNAFRQHGRRIVERPGALRPPVAAAMVLLAGLPAGFLVDPCCGSGTILGEAQALGWKAIGGDLDPDAVAVAAANVPTAEVAMGDCRRLDLASGCAGAWVSNVPFGRQFAMSGHAPAWLRATLDEAARVVRSGGRIVLLSPLLPRSAVPVSARLLTSYRIWLLGMATTIWVFQHSG